MRSEHPQPRPEADDAKAERLSVDLKRQVKRAKQRISDQMAENRSFDPPEGKR